MEISKGALTATHIGALTGNMLGICVLGSILSNPSNTMELTAVNCVALAIAFLAMYLRVFGSSERMGTDSLAAHGVATTVTTLASVMTALNGNFHPLFLMLVLYGIYITLLIRTFVGGKKKK